jgi:hypothetical protein
VVYSRLYVTTLKVSCYFLLRHLTAVAEQCCVVLSVIIKVKGKADIIPMKAQGREEV